LTTAAVRDGDCYRVSGQKIWTTYAQHADWCFLLTRTGSLESRHRGLTFLLVQMSSPGIRTKPIRQITAEEEYCEVFFDDVRVPLENRVGGENDGWHVAMTAANLERATYFIPHIARMRAEVCDLVDLIKRRQAEGAARVEAVGGTLVEGYVNLRALELQVQEMLTRVESNHDPGPEGALIKLLWSESRQALFELAMRLLHDELDAPQHPERDWCSDYLRTRSETILAGTSEIQRNLIAERILGLPR
jgi:alkylation response protein AidB-like acyl-CoA dehydrogenase